MHEDSRLRLRPQDRNQVAQLVLNFCRRRNGVSNLLTQQLAVAHRDSDEKPVSRHSRSCRTRRAISVCEDRSGSSASNSLNRSKSAAFLASRHSSLETLQYLTEHYSKPSVAHKSVRHSGWSVGSGSLRWCARILSREIGLLTPAALFRCRAVTLVREKVFQRNPQVGAQTSLLASHGVEVPPFQDTAQKTPASGPPPPQVDIPLA